MNLNLAELAQQTASNYTVPPFSASSLLFFCPESEIWSGLVCINKHLSTFPESQNFSVFVMTAWPSIVQVLADLRIHIIPALFQSISGSLVMPCDITVCFAFCFFKRSVQYVRWSADCGEKATHVSTNCSFLDYTNILAWLRSMNIFPHSCKPEAMTCLCRT